MLLEGEIVVITGAGRGIGKATALLFASEGAKVVLAARNRTQLEEVASHIADLKGECLILPTDVSIENEVTACFDQALGHFGRIDILINNAGVLYNGPFLETSLEVWDQLLGVNLRGVILCTRAALPTMVANGSGKIINVASGAGLRGLPGGSVYAASKAAVIALGASLAGEVEANGIKVNTICPGPINTEMQNPSRHKDAVQKSSKLLPPDDVAGAALYLASKLSGKTSGQTISVRTSNRW
ncbi:MAG: SDR family NAD(P)-dependent oxidoreductase [Verrucomicrobia bacterium]|nr:SDR family NAD(P)-dependent oxidoreductase [Verrucomicrobiota bacterium]